MPFLLEDDSGFIALEDSGLLLLETDSAFQTDNPVRFKVRHRKGKMNWDPIASTSLEYVGVDVKAVMSGSLVDPTVDTVQMAFMTDTGGELPDSGDWNTATWDTNSVPTIPIYTAFCLVGPGGTIELDPDDYIVYVKITDSPEVPVKRVPGLLTVF